MNVLSILQRIFSNNSNIKETYRDYEFVKKVILSVSSYKKLPAAYTLADLYYLKNNDKLLYKELSRLLDCKESELFNKLL